jgi:hypothetical protein
MIGPMNNENLNRSEIAAALTAKVAAMSYDERWARLVELSHTELTPETELEFAKLLFGAEATVAE